MPAPTLTQIGTAIVSTLTAGTYASAPIRAQLAGGRQEARRPVVIVAPPAIGFDVLGEGFVMNGSDWSLELYSSKGREADQGTELAFTDAVIAALIANPTLSGVVSCAYAIGSDEAQGVTEGSEDNAPVVMFRRTIRIHVDH